MASCTLQNKEPEKKRIIEKKVKKLFSAMEVSAAGSALNSLLNNGWEDA